MRYRYLILGVSLILINAVMVAASHAATLKLSWDTPVKRENGTALVAKEIKGYKIEWRTSDKVKGGTKYTYSKQSGLQWIVPRGYSLYVPDWPTKKYEVRLLTIDINGLMSTGTVDKSPWKTVSIP